MFEQLDSAIRIGAVLVFDLGNYFLLEQSFRTIIISFGLIQQNSFPIVVGSLIKG